MDLILWGMYNVIVFNLVKMKEFCYILGKVLVCFFWLFVLDIVLELLLGEGVKLVLEG